MYPLNKEPVVYKKCPNGVVALCATCHFHARAGGHKLGEHTFADPSEAEDKPEGSPTEEPQLVSKGPATNESNFGDRNSFGNRFRCEDKAEQQRNLLAPHSLLNQRRI